VPATKTKLRAAEIVSRLANWFALFSVALLSDTSSSKIS
jgi:hypothetical protein